MAQRLKPTGSKHMCKVKEKSSTQMATTSTANITCHKNTAKECTFGELTTQNTKANLRKTLCKVRPVYISPQTNTFSVGSKTASAMGKELMRMRMATRSMANGKTT